MRNLGREVPPLVTQWNNAVLRMQESEPKLYRPILLHHYATFFISSLLDPRRDLFSVGDGCREHEQGGRVGREDNTLLPYSSALRISDVMHLIENHQRVAPPASIQFVPVDLGRCYDNI